MPIRKKSISVTLLVTAILMSDVLFAAPEAKNVNVVNTPDVNIANMPDVNVANIPDVNVANVPDVNVTNDENSPIPVTIQNGAQSLIEYRVIGYTANPTDGSIVKVDQSLSGVPAMHALCAEVAPNARASFSDEAIRSPFVEGAPTSAWVIPARIEVMFRPDATSVLRDWTALDGGTGTTISQEQPTPLRARGQAACHGYTQADPLAVGLVFKPGDGSVSRSGCAGFSFVACSAPVEVPISP